MKIEKAYSEYILSSGMYIYIFWHHEPEFE